MNIVLFGIGQKFRQEIKKINALPDDIHIVGLCDNCIHSKSTVVFNDINTPLISPDMLSQTLYDKIIMVTNQNNYCDIKRQLSNIGISDDKIFYYDEWIEKIIKNSVISKLEKRYSDENDEKIHEYIKSMRSDELSVFNFSNKQKYVFGNYINKIFYDQTCGLFYTIYYNKRMYMSRKFKTAEMAADYICGISMEQDAESPHCYCNDSFDVSDGDVVIDAGVAEGNFALRIIDRVSKIYLVECDSDWVEALRHTFKDYMDKIIFCDKFLNDENSYKTITIDKLTDCQPVNFIKMDIEGAEPLALIGGEKTIHVSDKLKCCICAYHKHGDQSLINFILSKYGMITSRTAGYMYFMYDDTCYIDPEIRTAVIRAQKGCE